MAQHGLGYKPDAFDARDFRFQTHPARVAALPPSVDGRPFCGAIRDQGQQGSCTGHALAALREFLQNQAHQTPGGTAELSPAFIYWQERKLEHSTRNCDAGAYIRDGMGVLQKMGVCPEEDAPYTDSSCRAPKRTAKRDAATYKIAAYHRLLSVDEMKTALADGLAICIGITVYASFEGTEASTTGHIPMPAPGEQLLGGHALLAVGYRDDPAYAGGGVCTVQNSWGRDWGDSGFCYIPYVYLSDSKLCSDKWVGTL